MVDRSVKTSATGVLAGGETIFAWRSALSIKVEFELCCGIKVLVGATNE
jgi:hypothetical protein